MSKLTLKVSLSPNDTLLKLRDDMNADLVHEELHTLDEDKQTGTLIFERYYFRSKNRAALTVIADNFQGVTEVRAIATGSSEGIIFNFDWGAADNFAGQVERILEPYIISI